ISSKYFPWACQSSAAANFPWAFSRSPRSSSSDALSKRHSVAKHIRHKRRANGDETLEICGAIDFQGDQAVSFIEDLHGRLVERIDRGTVLFVQHGED